jgi:hypothetical protein
LAPQRASELMRAGKLHAYVGRAQAFAAEPADIIGSVESLGTFVVIRLNPIRCLPGMRAGPAPRPEPSSATWQRERVAAGSSCIPIR